jgi:hypothetical protein
VRGGSLRIFLGGKRGPILMAYEVHITRADQRSGTDFIVAIALGAHVRGDDGEIYDTAGWVSGRD